MVLLLGVIPCKSSFWWMNQLVEVCVCLHSCANKKASFFPFQVMSTETKISNLQNIYTVSTFLEKFESHPPIYAYVF
jgi:hypothetical protein